MVSAASSRYLQFVALLFVVAILPLLLSAQTAPQSATVQQVTAREAGGVIEVEIQTSGGPVSPNTQAITGPDRIVVDFPGAMPSTALRALKVHQGALKGVRSGLFFRNPPITRIVLDLTGPQSYKISTTDHATVVRLAGAVDEQSASSPAGSSRQSAGGEGARLRDAALAARPGVAIARVSPASLADAAPKGAVELGERAVSLKRYPDTNRNAAAASADETPQPTVAPEAAVPPQPPPPVVSVTYENGMLRILADKATLSQVLYEVHLRTQAEIAIPAGAEQERVVADLGPAPARDVLAELLNGSAYNFIFVGEELSLQRVILTRRVGF